MLILVAMEENDGMEYIEDIVSQGMPERIIGMTKICEKCGEKLDEQFETCWKCANNGVELGPTDTADECDDGAEEYVALDPIVPAVEYEDDDPIKLKAPRVCRSCGNTEFFSKEVNANGGHGPALLPLGLFCFSTFTLVVCSQCGLTDWHVSPGYMDKVRTRFDKMP
jgi:predicted nucleic-acid-binding Zn-ribbon protein/ribosomal protein L40E